MTGEIHILCDTTWLFLLPVLEKRKASEKRTGAHPPFPATSAAWEDMLVHRFAHHPPLPSPPVPIPQVPFVQSPWMMVSCKSGH